MTSQLQLLNKLLQTKDFSVVQLNNLTADHFFNYKTEFNFIKNHVDQFGQVPDRLTFLNTFPEFDVTDVTEPDSYLLEQILKDYSASYMATQFNKVKGLLESGNIAAAQKIFTEAATAMPTSSAMTCIDLLTDTSRFDRYLDRLQNKDKYYLSTGFPELDSKIGGIDRENELMVIAARTGIGKSWSMLKMASEASKQQLRVGIYSGEMTADKVGYRLDTLLGNIDNTAITRGNDFDPSVRLKYQKYIEDLTHRKLGPIKVLTPANINGPATVSALDTFVKKEKIEILFVDQYSLLEDESGAKAMHERVANISKGLKNLQVLNGIPVIAVSQMNRTKNENGEQDSTQIGLSDRIGQDATSIIMLDRDITYADTEKTQIQDERLVLNIIKSRDGGSGKLVYRADFNQGKFYYLEGNLSAKQAEELKNEYMDDSFDYSGSFDDNQPF